MIILRQILDTVGFKVVNHTLTGSQTSVPSNTLTTILSLNASQDYNITRIVVSGTHYSKFELFIDNNVIETKRTGPNRDSEFLFISALLLNSGQILDIKVTHFYTGQQADYESTIYSIV